MPDSSLADFVTHGREERNLEYKSSFPWDGNSGKRLRARVTKTCLAMANVTGGGTVVVGVVEKPPGVFTLVGMSSEHLPTFTQDLVQPHLNQYADPYVDVTVTPIRLDGGGTFVVLQVRPFDRIPVICKKNGLEGLRAAAIYTRARKKHETIEVPSQSEMREILERSTQLSVNRWVESNHAAGLLIFLEPEVQDPAQFDKQLEDL